MSMAAAERLHISVFLAQLFLSRVLESGSTNCNFSGMAYFEMTPVSASPFIWRFESASPPRSLPSHFELSCHAPPPIPTIDERRSAQSRSQCRHKVEHVANQPVVGNAEDRRVRIPVDRDDHLRVLHARQMLDCATDAAGNV